MKPRILVIDDEADVRDALCILLKQWGCDVLAASSGPDALDQLNEYAQVRNLILSDYRLREGETGVEAIKLVQATLGAIPVVIITGDTAPERLKEATASDCVLLHKPLNAELLRYVLLEQLGSTVDA